MLQRAASNAYSWWWASHVRTKQSKWLEQNLQDMEEKVQEVLKLIEEDGDSFAKRAEMYYKKRPELINFVEESYRAYRALAERYDHISTELQNANNTIASVFPEQVQFAMDEEDDYGSLRIQKRPPEVSKPNIPKVPDSPAKDLKGLLTLTTRKSKPKKTTKTATTVAPKSGLSKTEALKEIDKLQKGILALQTEKEFMKVSYESCFTKYWEFDKQIAEMQEKICSLQDEFGIGAVIEDDEARALMTSAALKSCQETLAQLQEKQERSAEEARVEHQRIKDAQQKLESFKDEFLRNQIDQENPYDKNKSVEVGEKPNTLDEVATSAQKRELESLREKIKEQLEVGSSTPLTVAEMAEKVDELVTKVVGLESAVSSQTALIKRLRTETDELQAQIRSLEDDRATLILGKDNLSCKLREMEEKLHGIRDLNRNIEDQSNNLQTHITEAHCNLDHLTEKLHSVKPDEDPEVKDSLQKEDGSLVEIESQKVTELEHTSNPGNGYKKQQKARLDEGLEVTNSFPKEEGSPTKVRMQKESKEQEDTLNPGNDFKQTKHVKTEVGEVGEGKKDQGLGASVENLGEGEEIVSQSQADNERINSSAKCQNPKLLDKVNNRDSSQAVDNFLDIEQREHGTDQEDEPNWQQLFLNGFGDQEKVLLEKYTTVLQNYKEVKNKLSEEEKKNQDSLSETTVHLKELRSANAKKDEEIRSLRQKLTLLQTSLDENKDLKAFIDSADGQPTSNLLDDQTVEQKARTDKTTARTDRSAVAETSTFTPTEEEEEDNVKVILIDQPQAVSAVEEKFRMKIDELLEQNLDFWLRFSTSFNEIQKFQTGIQDLQAEISKIKEKVGEKHEGSHAPQPSLKSDAWPIYKHLREIQTELTVWLEQSVLLKDELQSRFSSLCSIQEEISKALKAGSEDDSIRLTSYQAAKFQGEVLNMQQENNKVADELQAGLDHVTGLLLEAERTLAKLNEEFSLSGSRKDSHIQLRHSTSRSRVPLQSFIFGAKPKKQSIFSCMNPAVHRKYNDLRSGLPMTLRSSSRKRVL